MRKNLVFAVAMLLVAFGMLGQSATNGPVTIFDYESCDIATMPAATLLLPYFEVDPSGLGENTLVTITNVSDTAVVAHVTVWSDWSFPVLDFNLYLTGYDVVSLSLRDLLVSGTIPNTARNNSVSPVGVRSRLTGTTASGAAINAPYMAFLTGTPNCSAPQGGAGAVPGSLLSAIQSALTGGPYIGGATACDQVGDTHDNMIGYMTFDTSSACTQTLPTVPAYWTSEVRFENQLIGDYIRLNDADGYAGASPLVHIKALPGGYSAVAGTITTNLPWTFYGRYQGVTATFDRRQPLPALFAARYIEAGAGFDTDFAVWREGFTDEVDTMDCDSIPLNSVFNPDFVMTEVVRFDERENPTTLVGGCQVSPCQGNDGTNETQLINVNNSTYIPSDPSSDTGGWVYFNAAIPEGTIGVAAGNRPTSNWVQVRMTGAGIYGVDFDAAYLGNGCQYFVGATLADGGAANISGEKIGPKWIRGSSLGWLGN